MLFCVVHDVLIHLLSLSFSHSYLFLFYELICLIVYSLLAIVLPSRHERKCRHGVFQPPSVAHHENIINAAVRMEVKF